MNGRSTAEGQVFEEIARLGIEAEVLECDPQFADTAAFCERYGYLPSNSANTIIVATKKEPKAFCACLALADTKLDVNHKVRALVGAKLSFATADETKALTGQMIGGVTVFGLPAGMPLYVDSAVMSRDYVILGGGSRSRKLRVAPSELRKIPAMEVVEGLARPA